MISVVALIIIISAHVPARLRSAHSFLESVAPFRYRNKPITSTMNLHNNADSRADAIVIGGGVGGLVSAVLLAKSGLYSKLTLFEKNAICGGRMNSQDIGPYRFDVGPSLLLLPDIYEKTFERMGKRFKDYVTLLRVDPFYRVFFEGEEKAPIDLCADDGAMKGFLETIDTEAYGQYKSYLSTANGFLGFGLPAVIEEQPIWQLFGNFVISCFRAFPSRSHASMLQSFFPKSTKLQALFSFQDLYIGLAPHETPAVFSLLQALEFEAGIFYPQGGFRKVAQAITDIASEVGVEIRYNSSVVGFDIEEENDLVTSCVTSDHDRFSADAFIVNVDSPQAEMSLLPARVQDERSILARPSCGIVSLNFGFNKTLSPLAHHSIFISSADVTRSWNTVSNPDNSAFDPDAFNFYVHAPSRTDLTSCPDGHDAITVLVPVPPLPLSKSSSPSDIDDSALVTTVRAAVLKRLAAVPGMPEDLERLIAVESSRSPVVWFRDFSLFRGGAFGLAHSLPQLSFLRPRFRHPRLSNLFRVGASTRPGNGVPLVMIGAKLVTDFILKNARSNNKY